MKEMDFFSFQINTQDKMWNIKKKNMFNRFNYAVSAES